MDISTAQKAGDLATKITVASGLLSEIANDAKESYWLVSGSIQLQDKDGDTRKIDVLPLSADETATLFTAIASIFKSRVDALNTELGGL